MKEQQPLSRLTLKVSGTSLPLFTTLLQSGIEAKTENGTSLGRFLGGFPGFTADYLAEVVQTIFLNGTAVDDLTIPLAGEKPVLALSAAMPGLAGAIFRKNSFHAALRTDTAAKTSDPQKNEIITVILKLFNSIARERGEELLRRGVCLQTKTLAEFFERRANLLQEIHLIQADGANIDLPDLARYLAEHDRTHLTIEKADD